MLAHSCQGDCLLSVAVESTLEDCVFDELENIVFVVCVMSKSCLCGCYILFKKNWYLDVWLSLCKVKSVDCFSCEDCFFIEWTAKS